MCSAKKLFVLFVIIAIVGEQVTEAHAIIGLIKKKIHWGSKLAALGAVGAAGAAGVIGVKALGAKALLIKKGLIAKKAGLGILGLKKAGLVTAGVLGLKAKAAIGAGIVAKAVPIKVLLVKGLLAHHLLSKIHLPQVIDLPTVNMPVNAVVTVGQSPVTEVAEVTEIEEYGSSYHHGRF